VKRYRVTVTRTFEFYDLSEEDAMVTALNYDVSNNFEVGDAQVAVEDGDTPTVRDGR
jgi:hypothetical protein